MNSITPHKCPLCVGGFFEVGGKYKPCPYCQMNGCAWPGQNDDKTDRLINDIIEEDAWNSSMNS